MQRCLKPKYEDLSRDDSVLMRKKDDVKPAGAMDTEELRCTF